LNNQRYIEVSFGIDWLERTYGKQPYFICNKTEKRVKHLLIVSGLLKTRHQFIKMNYYSEHETVMDRHARAARRIRRKYGKDIDLTRRMDHMIKPAYIHQKTWDKWCFKESWHYWKRMNAFNSWAAKRLNIQLPS